MEMKLANVCQICGEDKNVIREPLQKRFGDYYYCPNCGKYIVESMATDAFHSKKVRSSLYYYLRNVHKDISKPLMITTNDAETIDYHLMTIENILMYYPNSIEQRLNSIMENLFELESRFGAYINLFGNYILNSALFFTDSEDTSSADEVENVLKILSKLELIKTHESSLSSFMIDYKGWERLDEINKSKTKSKKAFIAMWFDEKMNEFRNAIKEAAIISGFIPVLIDEKEHNNQIVPEILYEIRSSDFIIADITGSRNGVYYEAGYALGLGKEVILTFMDNEDDAIHFDVNQKNQIRYKNAEELKDKLIKRINATIAN